MRRTRTYNTTLVSKNKKTEYVDAPDGFFHIDYGDFMPTKIRGDVDLRWFKRMKELENQVDMFR